MLTQSALNLDVEVVELMGGREERGGWMLERAAIQSKMSRYHSALLGPLPGVSMQRVTRSEIKKGADGTWLIDDAKGDSVGGTYNANGTKTDSESEIETIMKRVKEDEERRSS